ncbi:hypothetical protein N7492_010584 [Penicillium capsulatum]|uniref:FAD-binding domain-containing protein n=1 Tax=Penicillium capsulatum TaxID=69766 RepID=A0A9W9LF20_9EURO|nr:hypothetical protein N7492_010584 [Penicillium capsulatum]KAJ6113084.1 hypothetical protein N7512_008408 [Penicillium capsulatum]
MSQKRKAIIIGAGPAGLAAALRLHQQTNISCTLYELRPEPTTLGGAIGIPSNGLRLLHRLGVYDKVIARGFGGSTMTLHSVRGHIVGAQEIVGWAREKTGFGYLRIKRADLVDILLEAVHEALIPIHFGRRVTSIGETDRVRVLFEDGSTDEADMVFGCDGIHSFVRSSVVDPGQAAVYSGMSGLATLIAMEDVSAETRNLINGMEATLTEDGMLAVTPCTAEKNELFLFFSKEVALPDSGDSRDGWEAHGREQIDNFKDMLLGLLESGQGKWARALRELVDKTSVVKFYPVYRLPPGRAWSQGRCVLIGDAAHAMSPHAGQGVSMALEDVFLLSRLLEDSNRALVEVCRKYDEIRRPRINEIYETAAQNADVRRKTGPLGLWFKEIGLSLALILTQALGLDKGGLKQKQLIYDIDQVEL